jgi:hypothetical protein
MLPKNLGAATKLHMHQCTLFTVRGIKYNRLLASTTTLAFTVQ